MAKHPSGALRDSKRHLRSGGMSDNSTDQSAPLDLDAIEAELAEVELMLERFNAPNTP
jgi:hypothetical protein